MHRLGWRMPNDTCMQAGMLPARCIKFPATVDTCVSLHVPAGRLEPCDQVRCPYGRSHTLANGTAVWINSAPYAGRGVFTYGINAHRCGVAAVAGWEGGRTRGGGSRGGRVGGWAWHGGSSPALVCLLESPARSHHSPPPPRKGALLPRIRHLLLAGGARSSRMALLLAHGRQADYVFKAPAAPALPCLSQYD